VYFTLFHLGNSTARVLIPESALPHCHLQGSQHGAYSA
jgi:hypothetical protein